jgi:hypothetical protein
LRVVETRSGSIRGEGRRSYLEMSIHDSTTTKVEVEEVDDDVALFPTGPMNQSHLCQLMHLSSGRRAEVRRVEEEESLTKPS